MSIKIEYLLKRNKITFENFCKKENIKSFEDLLSYCLDRGFEPCLEEEFNKIFIIEKEIILKLGRLQISLELEEFVSVFLEMEAASSLIHKILLTRVQNTQDDKEIN